MFENFFQTTDEIRYWTIKELFHNKESNQQKQKQNMKIIR